MYSILPMRLHITILPMQTKKRRPENLLKDSPGFFKME
jgi:hypothetical protein